jgi:hypothetical protein
MIGGGWGKELIRKACVGGLVRCGRGGGGLGVGGLGVGRGGGTTVFSSCPLDEREGRIRIDWEEGEGVGEGYLGLWAVRVGGLRAYGRIYSECTWGPTVIEAVIGEGAHTPPWEHRPL